MQEEGRRMDHALGGPGFLSSRSNFGADISLIFALAFTTLFIISGFVARKGFGLTHHWMILTSMTLMFGYFIYYYNVRRLGVESYSDKIHFGAGLAYMKFFRPVLLVHFTTVVLSSFFAIYTAITGFRAAERIDGEMKLSDKRLTLSKPLWSIGLLWLGFIIWTLSAILGSVHGDRGFSFAVMFIVIGYLLPAGIALVIHKTLPYAERRHRVMGRVTVGLYGLLLVTSILTWSILYVL
jgi:uncharacterized membrane protein YozB (DUF420 family)